MNIWETMGLGRLIYEMITKFLPVLSQVEGNIEIARSIF